MHVKRRVEGNHTIEIKCAIARLLKGKDLHQGPHTRKMNSAYFVIADIQNNLGVHHWEKS